MKRKIIFSTIVFFLLCYCTCTDVKAQSYYTATKTAYVSNISTGGYTTDTLFTLSGKYEFCSIQAYGNHGEYCEVRLYANAVDYGTFRVYSGQIINIPNPPNIISIIPDMDVDLGTLTEFVNDLGDTITPFVYCIAFTK